MTDNEQLRRDIRLLGDMLGEVIVEQEGRVELELVQRVRSLARDRRANVPGAEGRLAEQIAALGERDVRIVSRALSIFFDLSNLAEDKQRVRVLRRREQELSPEPLGESIGAAVAALHAAGYSASQTQAALDQLNIELVFTAHPSEAKRRSVRSRLRRMRQALQQLDRGDLLERERRRRLAEMRADMTVLWCTEFLRHTRPTVQEEVERGLSIMPRLWEVVPTIYAALRKALDELYPRQEFRIERFLHFGSWIGGDRDGHPYVTTEVTARTLSWLRNTAISLHRAAAQANFDFLTVGDRDTDVDRALRRDIAAACERWPEFAEYVGRVAPHETVRRWIKLIDWRLAHSQLAGLDEPPASGAYRSGTELQADVGRLVDSVRASLPSVATETEAQRWLDLTRVFGLHLTRLDVRQDARRYREVLAEILRQWNVTSDFGSSDEPDRLRILQSVWDTNRTIEASSLSPLAQDTLRLFAALYEAAVKLGSDALGGHVISMARYPSDVLTVLWFWQRAQRAARREQAPPVTLRIVPLFEKIDDLAHAPETLAAILDHPLYAEYLRGQDQRQVVMVGYSDSTKDGGYLAACWGLYQAQDAMHREAIRRGVRLTFFHGRGGSLGRGGGPAARGILSLPTDALGGSLRLTEQGEVLAERYDDPQVAYRHLEQVTWATLVASNIPGAPIRPEWQVLMNSLAERSWRAYRELVDQPDFIRYFAESTPIEEIENLPIASRPSRRTGQRTLGDLRAIPWVFAWTQNRCLLPAWYGLGTALTEIKYRDRHGWQLVCDMYQQWPFFQATIDNAALALSKADTYIGQRYSELTSDARAREQMWCLIAAECDRSRQAIRDIMGGAELLAGVPWLNRSIELRNPSIDPLNLMQIDLLRRRRALPDDAPDAERLRDLLRLTVQGIAAGMRTTG